MGRMKASNNTGERHMLTAAALKRLAISLICLAAVSGPALMVA